MTVSVRKARFSGPCFCQISTFVLALVGMPTSLRTQIPFVLLDSKETSVAIHTLLAPRPPLSCVPDVFTSGPKSLLYWLQLHFL